MFMYEKDYEVDGEKVEALNIVFGDAQIPAEEPDVVIYKKDGKVVIKKAEA